MTVKDLRDYRAVCAELIQRSQRLRDDRRHVFDAVQSSAEFPYSLHTVVVEGDVYPYPVLPEFDQIAALRQKKEAVERWAKTIDDYTVRRIVSLYFLVPAHGVKPTWEDVADLLDDGSSGDACRMKFIRYMVKNSE